MERYEGLNLIEEIGDIEDNFIVEIARGVSEFINTIDAKINKIKKSHLDVINRQQNSNLIKDVKDINDTDFTNSKDERVYIVPKSERFFLVNDFYTDGILELNENVDFIENSIKVIKRFRTKEKLRLSMTGPDRDIIIVKELLAKLDKEKGKAFDSKITDEFSKVGKYFGNASTTNKSIKRCRAINKEIDDRTLHSIKEGTDRLAGELKKLINMLDSTDSAVSKDAMNNIILRVNVAADYITAFANMYYIHTESIISLIDLKEKTE